MKIKLNKLIFALASTLLPLSAVYSGIPNSDHPTTFLGPTLKGGFTDTITNNTAFSLAGEAGIKNFRAGGTLGWKLAEQQRLKVSAEFLYQKITYPFFSGNTDQWVSQAALGAAYLYEFADYPYNPAVGVSAYISRAPSDTLSTVTGTFVNKAKVRQNFVDARRIAGSNANGISPEVLITPWQGGEVAVELNYDNVRYDFENTRGEDARGFGGTFRIYQIVTPDIGVGASAAVRQPFNNYAANINWTNVPYLGRAWVLGLDGDYTAGKEMLPNTYNVSLSVNYALDGRPPITSVQRSNLKGDLKGEIVTSRPISDDLIAWTADPAVYLPQVLAVPDEKVDISNIPKPEVVVGCASGVPTFVGTIPNQSTGGGASTVTVNSASFFTGKNLSFSFTQSHAPLPGNTLNINSTTGVLTATGPSTDVVTVTITATNPCGSAVSNNFTILY